MLDAALMRPGRFDKLVYVPPPDYEARLEILQIHTRKMPLENDVNLEAIALMVKYIQSHCRTLKINAFLFV